MVHDLELCLQVLVLLVEIFDFLVALEVLLDLERHQEFGQVGTLVALIVAGCQKINHGVDGTFITGDQTCN